MAFKLGAPLSSGLNKASTCGAATAAYLVLGVKYNGDKKIVKQKTKEFDSKFLEQNKYLNCKELLGADITIPEEKEQIIESGKKSSICPNAISTSINILKEL